MKYTEEQLSNTMRQQIGEFTRRPLTRAIRQWDYEKKLAWCLKFGYLT